MMKKKDMIEIMKNCLEAIEAGGDIKNGTLMLIEDNLKSMLEA